PYKVKTLGRLAACQQCKAAKRETCGLTLVTLSLLLKNNRRLTTYSVCGVAHLLFLIFTKKIGNSEKKALKSREVYCII
ncbi:MAG: hypothetical protein RR956_02995, partial [Christensenella sp.]